MCEVLERMEKRGIEQGRFEILVKLVLDGKLTLTEASEEVGMDEAAFREKMNK